MLSDDLKVTTNNLQKSAFIFLSLRAIILWLNLLFFRKKRLIYQDMGSYSRTISLQYGKDKNDLFLTHQIQVR